MTVPEDPCHEPEVNKFLNIVTPLPAGPGALCVFADLFAPHENAWVKILSSQLALIYTSLDKNRSLFELSCFPPRGPFNPPWSFSRVVRCNKT